MSASAPETVKEPRKLRNGGTSGRGRTKGSKNKLSIVREQIGGLSVLEGLEEGIPALGLPPIAIRLAKLLTHRSAGVRLGAEKFCYEALHGKPKQQLDIKHALDIGDDIHEAAERARAILAARAAASPAQLLASDEDEVIEVRAVVPDGNGNGNGHG